MMPASATTAPPSRTHARRRYVPLSRDEVEAKLVGHITTHGDASASELRMAARASAALVADILHSGPFVRGAGKFGRWTLRAAAQKPPDDSREAQRRDEMPFVRVHAPPRFPRHGERRREHAADG